MDERNERCWSLRHNFRREALVRPMPMTQFCHRIIINGVTSPRTKLTFLLFDDLMLHPRRNLQQVANSTPPLRGAGPSSPPYSLLRLDLGLNKTSTIVVIVMLTSAL